jgi:hypothetical protein
MPAPAPPSTHDHRSAWRAPALQRRQDWVLQLGEQDNAELRHAIAHAKRLDSHIPGLGQRDFPLPGLAARLRSLQDELVDGLGLMLVRGFDISAMPVEDAALAFWGMGAHLGVGKAQNAQGDLLGHVTDLGVDYRTNTQARGYQTCFTLPFHSDGTDVVGLLCVRKAKEGGASMVVSAIAVHNAIAERRPDLLPVGYQDFYQDKRGEAPEGTLPYTRGPLFNPLDGRLFCRYNRGYIESAQRFPEVPRLTAAQVELLDLMDELCASPEFCLDMHLEPGDMQFLCNYTCLHSRTEYVDDERVDQRRYLLRLWLDSGRFPRLPPYFADRLQDMARWQSAPRPPVFDLSMVRTELAH